MIRQKDVGRSAQMTRINADLYKIIIRENPRYLCHPRPIHFFLVFARSG